MTEGTNGHVKFGRVDCMFFRLESRSAGSLSGYTIYVSELLDTLLDRIPFSVYIPQLASKRGCDSSEGEKERRRQWKMRNEDKITA